MFSHEVHTKEACFINDGKTRGAARTTGQVHMSINAKKFVARRLLDKILERCCVNIASGS